MINKNSLLTIPFYNKTSFTGSYKGMRYKIAKEKKTEEENKESFVFTAYAFPGPLSFDATAKDKMIIQQFVFSDQGISDVCNWLNKTYQDHLDLWETSIL